jgi:hypothetical protein
MITGGIVGIATLTLAAFRNSYPPQPKISPENSQKRTQSSLSDQSDNAVPAVIPEQKSQPTLEASDSLSNPANVLRPPTLTSGRNLPAHSQDAAASFNKGSDARYPLRRTPAQLISQTGSATKDAKAPQPVPTDPSSPPLGQAQSSDGSSNVESSQIPCENLGEEHTANTISEPPSLIEDTGIEGHAATNQPIVQTQFPPLTNKINPTHSEPDSQATTPLTAQEQDQPITPDPLISNKVLTSTDTLDTNPCHLKQPAGKN